MYCECGPTMTERANWSAHTDTQLQVAASRQLLRSDGLKA